MEIMFAEKYFSLNFSKKIKKFWNQRWKKSKKKFLHLGLLDFVRSRRPLKIYNSFNNCFNIVS